MKPFILFSLLLTVGLLWGCDNSLTGVYDNVYKKEKINGTALLRDIYIDTGDTAVAEVTIYLYKEKNGENYLLRTTTDKEGKFSFSHRPGHSGLYIIGEFKNSKGIEFKTTVSLEEFSKDSLLILQPDYPGKKVKITVLDINKQPLTGAEVYLFSNNQLAASVEHNEVSGFIRKGVSNEKGNVFFFNLTETNYYLSGKRGPLLPDFSKQLTLSDTKEPKTETLTLSAPAELIVKVKDSRNQPIYNAGVYLFSSQSQTGSILSKVVASFDNSTTDREGTVKFRGLTPGQIYYLDARYAVTLKDTVIVKNNLTGPVTTSFPSSVTLTLEI